MDKDIKFIYFDVGGVVILDFSKTNKWNEMASDLGLDGENKDEFFDLFGKYELEICTSDKSLDDFIDAAKKELYIKFSNNYSMLDDFVDRFEVNESIHPILEKLSKKYKLGLLTNMYPGMLDKIKARGILPGIDWDVVIDSSIVKLRKPQKEIFQLAQEQAQVEPHQILFVENSQTHIDAAKAQGWQTLLYDPSDSVESNRKLCSILMI